MSVSIGKLEFEGPIADSADIREEPGLFGIVCEVGDELELIEFGETDCLKDCLTSEEHVNNIHFYSENCGGRLAALVHYTPDLTPSERREIKDQLIAEFDAQPEVELVSTI